jgi:hypothetical protein
MVLRNIQLFHTPEEDSESEPEETPEEEESETEQIQYEDDSKYEGY